MDLQERKAEKEKRRQRMIAVSEAVQEEMTTVNNALSQGGIASIQTFCGKYQIDCVRTDWWYVSHPVGTKKDAFNTRSWAGCNNDTWLSILEQLGLERHPLFQKSFKVQEMA